MKPPQSKPPCTAPESSNCTAPESSNCTGLKSWSCSSKKLTKLVVQVEVDCSAAGEHVEQRATAQRHVVPVARIDCEPGTQQRKGGGVQAVGLKAGWGNAVPTAAV